MQKITPFLLFDGNAEEAMKFYTSVFKSSKIVSVRRFPGPVPGDKGQIITGTIQILGQEFMVLQGGPRVPHSMAISFFVNCENQAEVDYLWEKLSEGGQKSQCGWLADKFGVWWQIIPTVLGRLMGDQDPEKAGRVMQAMLKMTRIDIAGLQKAYDGT
jgi:predicted 3-demethylubiquinone-9 3-methyltransferase (glyoxalase superfamily)